MNRSTVDVLCIGYACTDLTYQVAVHPAADEKIRAQQLMISGGGPAANAAVAVSRLGGSASFIGRIGSDPFAQAHLEELADEGVHCEHCVRFSGPSPLATVYVKPDGKRSIVDYRRNPEQTEADVPIKIQITPKVILFDGHRPELSASWLEFAEKENIPTILDAGSVHEGTRYLCDKVDYLIASQRFGTDFTDERTPAAVIEKLQGPRNLTAVTWGDKGVYWSTASGAKHTPAYPVECIDSNGAGDAFHGAFAYFLSQKVSPAENVGLSSAVAALNCCGFGGRPSLPRKPELLKFLHEHAPRLKSLFKELS